VRRGQRQTSEPRDVRESQRGALRGEGTEDVEQAFGDWRPGMHSSMIACGLPLVNVRHEIKNITANEPVVTPAAEASS